MYTKYHNHHEATKMLKLAYAIKAGIFDFYLYMLL